MSSKDKIKEYFDRSTSDFDAIYCDPTNNPYRRFLNKTFRWDIYERYRLTMNYVKEHKPGSVLDVGCGPGQYLLDYAEQGAKRIVGIDFSRKMIELAFARTRIFPNAGRIFEFKAGNFADLELEDKFDLIVAMGFFDYESSPLDSLKKMRSKSLAAVLASFPSISIYRTPIRKIRYLFKRCPVYFYTEDKIRALSLDAGFRGCTIKKIAGSGMDYFVNFSV